MSKPLTCSCGQCDQCLKRTYDRNYRVTHREEIKRAHRQWKINNPERYKYHHNLYNQNRKRRVIEAYGGRCQCCGETEMSFLSIDHINNDGGTHRRELKSRGGGEFYSWLLRHNCPQDKFQCLCMNCQFGKRKTGICPHQNSGGILGI